MPWDFLRSWVTLKKRMKWNGAFHVWKSFRFIFHVDMARPFPWKPPRRWTLVLATRYLLLYLGLVYRYTDITEQAENEIFGSHSVFNGESGEFGGIITGGTGIYTCATGTFEYKGPSTPIGAEGARINITLNYCLHPLCDFLKKKPPQDDGDDSDYDHDKWKQPEHHDRLYRYT
jgi:hypothetical protein